MLIQNGSTDDLLDVIGDAYETSFGHPDLADTAGLWHMREAFLEDHRLAFDVIDGVVDKTSEELHREVVVPALSLLHGRPRSADAEWQYRDALDELAGRKWGDAITDANAAVEQTLRIILGRGQGQLRDLLAEARQRGLFGDAQERWLSRS